MKVVIFNYNMPIESDQIFAKLISDGYLESDIIYVDNGSDKSPVPGKSNFRLPWNVRFTGQAYSVLSYLLNFSDDDDFLLITTSARLRSDVNYRIAIEASLRKCNGQYGFIATGLYGGATDTNCPQQKYDEVETNLREVFDYQPIVTLVSRKLLELCWSKKNAYFNLDLVRGWGIDRELQYTANANGIRCYIDKSIPVEWVTNSAHKKGLADESVKSYHNNAQYEMEVVFIKKYGLSWQEKFEAEFNGKKIEFSFISRIKRAFNFFLLVKRVRQRQAE